ncbi:hypothetical protein ACJX0J_038468 [Zea mays]
MLLNFLLNKYFYLFLKDLIDPQMSFDLGLAGMDEMSSIEGIAEIAIFFNFIGFHVGASFIIRTDVSILAAATSVLSKNMSGPTGLPITASDQRPEVWSLEEADLHLFG